MSDAPKPGVLAWAAFRPDGTLFGVYILPKKAGAFPSYSEAYNKMDAWQNVRRALGETGVALAKAGWTVRRVRITEVEE